MSVPGIVQSTLDGEEIAARVSLGGEDELFITPSSTLVYRADGLLSDESVDEFPHDADRLTLSEGRRKTKFTLEYPLEGAREFTVPSSMIDDVLHPVLAGVLNGNGITDPGETVVKTYRFSELTLIITSDRLVKHIGGAVWDEDYEEYHFDDVTSLSFEDGSVATQIVLVVDGRPERIKAPNEEANDLRERLKRALFDYHDVSSLEELNEAIGEDDDGGDADRDGSSVDFGDGVDPLDADPPEPDDHDGASQAASSGEQSDDPLTGGVTSAGTDAAQSQSSQADQTDRRSGGESGSQAPTATDDRSSASNDRARSQESGTSIAAGGNVFEDAAGADTGTTAGQSEPASSTPETDPELLERLDALETAVERQNDRIERQQQTIERLIAELRQGR